MISYSIKYISIFSLLCLVFFVACIEEDIIDDRIDEKLTITNPIDSLQIGDAYQLEAIYLDEIGDEATADLFWVSSDETVISVDEHGQIEALTTGDIFITVTLEGRENPADTIYINSGMSTSVITVTERNGTLQTTSSYALSGDFSIVDTDTNMGLELRLADDFVASSALPGLVLYLTNNPSTNSGALEISPITTFTGAQTFVLDSEIKIGDYSHVLFYCKPFSVKVGDGEFSN